MENVYEQKPFIQTMPYREAELKAVINKLKVIRLDQLAKLMDFSYEEKDEYMHYINDLIKRSGICRVTDDNYIVAAGITEYDRRFTECLWDVIRNRKKMNFQLLDLAEPPADLFYMSNDGTVIVDTYIDYSNSDRVLYLQERYYARQNFLSKKEKKEDIKSDHLINVFVVTDMLTANRIAENYDLTMPYRICLVDYDNMNGTMPAINYFQPN